MSLAVLLVYFLYTRPSGQRFALFKLNQEETNLGWLNIS
jgi:hypothetical protein